MWTPKLHSRTSRRFLLSLVAALVAVFSAASSASPCVAVALNDLSCQNSVSTSNHSHEHSHSRHSCVFDVAKDDSGLVKPASLEKGPRNYLTAGHVFTSKLFIPRLETIRKLHLKGVFGLIARAKSIRSVVIIV